LYLPHDGAERIVSPLTGTVHDRRSERVDADEALRERISVARAELVEAIIAESEDEDLMDRYLQGEPIEEASLIADLETAVARGGLHPVLPVCAATGLGLHELLDGIARGCPAPPEHVLPEFTSPS